MKIRSLGYNPEADELDLLIDVDAPVPAESIPIDAGIYIRRDPATGRVVGAFIRGYSLFVRKVRDNQPIPSELSTAAGFVAELEAIIAWQREVDELSRNLAGHLGDTVRQGELIQALLNT